MSDDLDDSSFPEHLETAGGGARAENKYASQEMAVLYAVSHALTHRQDVTGLLQDVLDVLAREKKMTYGSLTLRKPDTDTFVIEASRGLTPEEVRRGEYSMGEGITGTVAATGRPLLVPDISRDPRFLNRTRARTGQSTAFICVPIIHRGQVVGTLSVDCQPTSERDLQANLAFLMLLTNLIAEAVASMREHLAERESLKAENERLRRQLGDRYQPANLVGNGRGMRLVYDQIAQVADSPATVLIRGESGTGKELVARALHYGSSRRDGPFISVNCAALPENLIESELFGHEKGAFTGAQQQRKGRFELAHGGSLFLDEIGDIAAPVQIRLLRVLQERSFERIGGDTPIKVNVRIIAATNRDLEKAIRDGRFREDLYYRLNVFPIYLPPLRERRSDILLLAEYFLKKYAELYDRRILRISTTAINMMMVYHWPGNVRELENCIERAVLTSTDDVIHGYTLPPTLQTGEATRTAILPDEGASLKTLVDSYEREIIVDALKKHQGSGAAAARFLQTTPRILNYRIRQLGIDPKAYR
ncbi:MAG: sigma 54-interacting transcriptional regulator [Lentisphaerae bacterium]|nr:sigma 54-interacting transcriptional regulator [Lentisphaerota bacterium]